LQLGGSGVEVMSNWTVDCHVEVSAHVLGHLDGDGGVLLASADGIVHLGAEADLVGLLLSLSDGWHRLTVQVEQLPQYERRTLLVDGVPGAVSEIQSLCGVTGGCPITFFAVGGLPDRSATFPLPIHHLRLYSGVLNPTDASESVHKEHFAPLRYHAENSRWVELSRGPDAVDITWDTFGWDARTHEQVRVTLERTGDLLLTGTNTSRLWDRTVASASGITGQLDVANWTSAAPQGAEALHIVYAESDPCYDLWDGIECSQSDWPVGRTDCGRRLHCAGLGWDPEAAGSVEVCGTSTLAGLLGSGDMCVREASFADASNLCQEMGARLCTAGELRRGEADPSACGYDSALTWSWVHSGQMGACPGVNQSLGVAGAASAWYSFSASAPGEYHEIQLRAEGTSSHFISTDILDEAAELVHAAEKPTLHRRADGVMLRWNITQGGGPYYVRVTSRDLDSPFSMIVIAPPVYRLAPADPKVWPPAASERIELSMSVGGSAAPVDLGFSFPFFGLAYDRMWVSSSGYLAFERPPKTKGLVGLDAVHSAVVAAAGDYDLSKSGATLTISHRGAAGLDVAWHAPLYNSSVFTDVALRLAADGTVEVRWERIDLSESGSLTQNLVSWLIFDTLFVLSSMLGAIEDAPGDTVSLKLLHTGQATLMDPGDKVANVTIGIFYGADHNEGLDLAGDFVYAVNMGGHGKITVGDAIFTGVNTSEGVTMWTEGMTGYYFGASSGGVTDDDTTFADTTQGHSFSDTDCHFPEPRTPKDLALEKVLATHVSVFTASYLSVEAGTSVDKTINMALAVEQGAVYRMQFLFMQHQLSGYPTASWANRCVMDILVDGAVIAPQFNFLARQGITEVGTKHTDVEGSRGGVFLLYEFTAQRDSIRVQLVRMENGWAELNGLTLERVITATPTYPSGESEMALRLVDDAFLQLPPMTLGSSVAISAWVSVGTLWDGAEGVTLFNSFESTFCGDSDGCRNAVDGTTDRHGWLAIGNDIGNKRPADLWTAGVDFDQVAATSFWEEARDAWLMVTIIISGQKMSVYTGGQLRGVGTLVAPLPRMLREANYIGAAHGVPFHSKAGGISLAIADFRLYDRSLRIAEVVALFTDPSGEHTACCVVAGIKDAFSVGDVDLTAQAMDVVSTGVPAAVAVSPQIRHDGENSVAGADACGSKQAQASKQTQTPRQVDICSDYTIVTDCNGVVSDGIGPYTNSANCALHLAGSPGIHYMLDFEEFETEADVDFLFVYDGASNDAPLLGRFTGKELPTALASSGSDVYLRFTSNDKTQAVGFRATFACIGSPLEYWKPATVATVLPLGIPTGLTTLQAQQTACLGDVLLSVQCCADAELYCANARVTEVKLSKHQLRGSLPQDIGSLGALQSLKLHDNFLTGTFPSSLGKLHWLKELQLSHNQFAMQARVDLSKILGGMLQLQTLDLGMSNEVADLHRSIILPAPPVGCRVGEPCGFALSTRTVAGLPLPHGGLQLWVRTVDGSSDTHCADLMDGSYDCQLPPTWTATEGVVDFVVNSDGEDFVPIRTLTDPTTGVVSTQDTYQRLAVLVAPIECTAAHAHPDGEGAQCVCEGGYYRLGTTTGGYSCERCDRGQEPAEGGARCSLCVPGKYSATGEGCAVCPAGNEPNLLSGADSCTLCGGHSISEYGDHCAKCEADQVADPSRTVCICPAGLYNSSRYGDNAVQCVPKNLRPGGHKTPSSCVTCDGLACVKCTAGLEMVPGWGTTGSDSPWIIFGCPFRHACINRADGQRCAAGHTGVLCAECEPGYGLTGEECVACKDTVHRWYVAVVVLGILVGVGLVVYLCWRHRQRQNKGSDDEMGLQLTDNPLQLRGQKRSPRGSLSGQASERRGNVHLAVRVLYQPVRILVGYIQARGGRVLWCCLVLPFVCYSTVTQLSTLLQVVTQIGPVLDLDFPDGIQRILNALKPLAIDLQSILQLDCLAGSDFTFYAFWVVRCFLLPGLMLAAVGVQYVYERQRVDRATALGFFKANAFVVVFLCYPGVCNQVLRYAW
jgi:hypothetical protein